MKRNLLSYGISALFVICYVLLGISTVSAQSPVSVPGLILNVSPGMTVPTGGTTRGAPLNDEIKTIGISKINGCYRGGGINYAVRGSAFCNPSSGFVEICIPGLHSSKTNGSWIPFNKKCGCTFNGKTRKSVNFFGASIGQTGSNVGRTDNLSVKGAHGGHLSIKLNGSNSKYESTPYKETIRCRQGKRLQCRMGRFYGHHKDADELADLNVSGPCKCDSSSWNGKERCVGGNIETCNMGTWELTNQSCEVPPPRQCEAFNKVWPNNSLYCSSQSANAQKCENGAWAATSMKCKCKANGKTWPSVSAYNASNGSYRTVGDKSEVRCYANQQHQCRFGTFVTQPNTTCKCGTFRHNQSRCTAAQKREKCQFSVWIPNNLPCRCSSSNGTSYDHGMCVTENNVGLLCAYGKWWTDKPQCQ